WLSLWESCRRQRRLRGRVGAAICRPWLSRIVGYAPLCVPWLPHRRVFFPVVTAMAGVFS
ncbi:MAG: hypothetical protein FWH14_08915, partial [Oscillospiraceae bacterium]|nr:hypothetical protein [Oscillospiraceae bacterium]